MTHTPFTYKELVEKWSHSFQSKNPTEMLEQLSLFFGSGLAFSTSFGIEDQVITDFLSKIPAQTFRVFTLDTGRLFEETYETHAQTILKYNLPIEVYFPSEYEVFDLLREQGPYGFRESVEARKECCNIRKIQPLKKALEGVKCWITGLRAEQSEHRSEGSPFEFDAKFGVLKFHPLFYWKEEELYTYAKKHSVPYNILHDQGFPSIGCAPCTRAVEKGASFRSGRWWWEESQKECGLHESYFTSKVVQNS